MNVSDLTVEVRDASLQRVGQILPVDLDGLELALRFNATGSWRITLRSDHPLVETLRLPGSGLIVTGPTGVLISGPTLQATQKKTTDDPTGTWEIVGTDDSVVLGERLAYPVPSTASLSGQTSAYDSRTGKAETVAKAYVNANIGPAAPTGRKISSLTVDADLARGNTVVVNARFDKLGELLYGILTPSGLGFDIKQVGSGLVFEVFQPVDRSAYIRMDVDNLRLSKSEYTYTSPGATRVIVAGQGQGAGRTLIERTSTASTAAETSWGRRIEVFKDQRNTNDTTELQTAGDEILAASGFTVEGIKVTPSDDLTSMRFGVDWGLGDKVTVVVGSAEVAKVVTEVGIVVGESGVAVGCTVGDAEIAADDATTQLVAGQTSQDARISNLERNEAGGSGSVSDGSITTAKLADGAVTNAKLANSAVTVNGTSIALGSSGIVSQSPNFVINGGVDVFQRVSFASRTSSGYAFDRWYGAVGGTVTLTQQTSGVPIGSRYCGRIAYNAASSFCNLYQAFESDVVSALRGETVTLSVKLRRNSAMTADLGIALDWGTAADTLTGGSWSQIGSGTGIANASIPTGTSSSDWVRISNTVQIPTSANGLRIHVFEGAAGVSGAYWEIAQVQLEVGSVATAFRRNANSMQAEVAACQRYYWRLTNSSSSDSYVSMGWSFTSTDSMIPLRLPVTMRRIPDATLERGGSVKIQYYSNSVVTLNSASINTSQSTTDSVAILASQTGGTSNAGCMFLVGANSYIGINAEL